MHFKYFYCFTSTIVCLYRFTKLSKRSAELTGNLTVESLSLFCFFGRRINCRYHCLVLKEVRYPFVVLRLQKYLPVSIIKLSAIIKLYHTHRNYRHSIPELRWQKLEQNFSTAERKTSEAETSLRLQIRLL